MSKDPEAFRDEMRKVTFAYEQTELHYDKNPPNGDIVPVAAAINAWTLICGCYMGIEQTMKLLIYMRRGSKERTRELDTHDLNKLYSLLDESERRVVADYYRIYRSLHNFDSGDIALDTADQFIQYIGNGYTSWRYILVEDPVEVPKVHIGLMLETWRALVAAAEHHVRGKHYETLAYLLGEYIELRVIRVAEMDDDWQAASQDENSNTNFRDIRDWIHQGGGALKVGIDLFKLPAHGRWQSLEASPLLRQVLCRAVTEGVGAPGTYKARRTDIAMFHNRITSDGLAWNADQRAFVSNP